MNSPTDWRDCAVPVFWGLPDTHRFTGEDYETRTLGQVFAMEPGRCQKSRGLAMLAGTHCGHLARCHDVQREHGRFVTLAGDIDKGDYPLAQISLTVRLFAQSAATLIYSTPHSRPGNRRWRIILPLAEPQGHDAWHDAQTVFFEHMERHEIVMDWALARAGQAIFLPNVPTCHEGTGEPLRGPGGTALHFRRYVNSDHAPGLRLDVDPIAGPIAMLRQRRAEERREHERLRREADLRRARRPNQGETVIDVFNRDNALEKLFVRYGYKRRDARNWRSPLQSKDGQSYATQVIGNGKWFSLSGSDLDAGLGARLRNGCIGDGFDLFVHFEHGGDRGAALRQLRSEAEGVAA